MVNSRIEATSVTCLRSSGQPSKVILATGIIADNYVKLFPIEIPE